MAEGNEREETAHRILMQLLSLAALGASHGDEFESHSDGRAMSDRATL